MPDSVTALENQACDPWALRFEHLRALRWAMGRSFGSKNIGPIYGLMLTAWGFASAFGPLLIAHLRQSSNSFAFELHSLAVIMAVSIVVPLIVRPPRAA